MSATLDGEFAYYTPNTLDGLDNVSGYLTQSLLIDGSNFMLADLNMNGHAVKNLASGAAPDEAVNLGQMTTALLLKADLSYVNTQLALKADDSTVVKLTGNQSIAGTKTFSSSPIVPAATSTGQAVRYDELILKADDNTVVKLTGNQTIAGVKTFTSNPVFPNPYVTLDTFQTITANKTFGSGYIRIYDSSSLREVACQANATAGGINPAIVLGDNVVYGGHGAAFGSNPILALCVASGTSNGLRLSSSTITTYSPIAMNNKSLSGLPAPVNSSDAVRLTDLNTKADDTVVVKKTLDQTIAGIKTFTSSPIVPAASATGQAVRYDELILKADTTTVNAALALKADDSSVVKLSGAQTVAGVKTFTSSPIVPAPVNLGEVARIDDVNVKANQTYVDAALALKADQADLVNGLAGKADTSYVDSQDSLRVLKAGDTMTGPLILSHATHPYMYLTQPVYRHFVSSFGVNLDLGNDLGTSGGVRLMPNNTAVFSATGTGITSSVPLSMSSQNINNVATATLSHQAVNLSQMQAADSAFVNLTTAQTVAGVKTFSSSPIVPAATSTGQAVRYNELILKADDNAVVKLTGAQTVAGVKTFSSSPIVPAAASTGQAVRYDELILKADDSVVVKLSGAQTIAGVKTFTNNLSMNSTQRIVNVVDPVNAQDVATKNYADTLITGIPRYPPLRTTQSGTTFTARTILASNIDPYVGDDVVETLNEGYIYTSQIYCVKNVTYTGIVVSFGTAGVAPNTPPNCNFVWGIFSQDGATRYAATGVNTPLTSSGPQAYDFTGGTFTCPASGYYVAVTYFRNNGGLSGTKCDFKMAKFSGWWSGNVNTVNNWETVASEQNFGVSGTFPTALSGAYTTRTQSPIFMMY